jgi:hypothetical protein
MTDNNSLDNLIVNFVIAMDDAVSQPCYQLLDEIAQAGAIS